MTHLLSSYARSILSGVPKNALQRPLLRQNWQIVLQKEKQKNGEYKYPDWEEVASDIPEPMKNSRLSLLDRHLRNTEHIKPTEMKRRINSKKEYERSLKKLNDLTKYIHFIRDSKKKQ